MAALKNQPISTFIFLDLEATGLAGIGEKPRITELSLVAVHRASLQEKCARNTPRVLNKLTLCLNPQKAIGHEASSITGLYNDALSLHCPFSDNVVDICNLFFEQLPLPICLLAHSGHRYDFPLLAAELHRIGRYFPEDILCADTLEGFRDILSIPEVQNSILKPNVKVSRVLGRPTAANGKPQVSQVNQKPVRRLQFTTAEHVPSSITPEMQVVKSNTNFGNAPKKKPQPVEVPKSVRVSSAKRKLEFGPSSSELAKNQVDDVDREDVMDSIHGFRLSQNGTRREKHNENKNDIAEASEDVTIGGSQGFEVGAGNWEEFMHEVPDQVLIEAMDQYEGNLPTSSVVVNQEHPSTVNSNQVQPCNPSAGQGESNEAGNESTFSVEPSGNKAQNEAEQTLSPVNTKESNSNSTQRTPTSNGAEVLNSFPTPSPSPHKDKTLDERVLSSTLSPLASPFVPRSFNSSPQHFRPNSPSQYTHNPLGISLALKSLHKRILGYEPEDSHRAEDDCMSLLRLSNQLSPWFCDWVDQNTSIFRSIPPLYKASKRPKKPSS